MNCYTCDFCVQHNDEDNGYYYQCHLNGDKMKPVRMQRNYDSSETYLTAPYYDCDVDVKELQVIIDKLQEEIKQRKKL